MPRRFPTRRHRTVVATAVALIAAGCNDRFVEPILPRVDGGISAICSTKLDGFGDGTEGGVAGQMVTVSTLADLGMYAGMDGPLIIFIDGQITATGQVDVAPNKTIQGVDINAKLLGVGLRIKDSSQVIVRNLTISKVLSSGDKFDAITIQHSDHVWIDHCDLSSDLVSPVGTYDSLIDINHASDFITVSWTKFQNHAFDVSFIGHTDDNATEDKGHFRVTYHHNLFASTGQNNPSLRFGLLHAYNNYYVGITSKGIVSRMGGHVFAEKNYFDNVHPPLTTKSESPEAGFIYGEATNEFRYGDPNTITQTEIVTVPYGYYSDAVVNVPPMVDACAGPGHI